MKTKDWESIARLFHDAYEKLASRHNYTTRKETREFNPKSNNGKLMISVMKVVVPSLLQKQKEEIMNVIENMNAEIVGNAEAIREGIEKKLKT